MKQLRLVASLAAVVCMGWAVYAIACPGEKTSAASSSKSACSAKGTSATTAAMNGGACCAAGASATTAAMKSGSCPAKGTSASMASADGSCSAHGSKGAMSAAGSGCCAGGAGAKTAMNGCEACDEISMCGHSMSNVSASVNVVRIKNGLMYVYTADAPARVQTVQAELGRRNEHVAAIMAGGDKSRLCPECKELRGALASGKLTRELVNVEGGCLLLVTSTDKTVVNKLHSIGGLKDKLAKS